MIDGLCTEASGFVGFSEFVESQWMQADHEVKSHALTVSTLDCHCCNTLLALLLHPLPLLLLPPLLLLLPVCPSLPLLSGGCRPMWHASPPYYSCPMGTRTHKLANK